jgi:hypothetical protein
MTIAAAVLAAALPGQAEQEIEVAVRGGKAGLTDVPVSAAISLPRDLADVPADKIAVRMVLEGTSGRRSLPGQVVRPNDGEAQLWWIVPLLPAGEKQTWTAALAKDVGDGKDRFAWQDEKGKHLDLLLAGRKVLRVMYAFDTSTKERAHETYKVYTHVFDAAGKEVITKGPGGLYTHHRGLFIGWRAIQYDGKKRGDWWHMKGVTQVHRKFADLFAGPVLAGMTAVIHWNDGEGRPVVIEQRRHVVFRQPAPAICLVDFRTKLTATRSDVVLDGDPEHAGMQYRPHNDVADNKSAKYLFPDAAITTKNVKARRDLPWAAETYTLREKAYAVQHMNHPGNPKGTRTSAYRNYGRFGAFAKVAVGKGEAASLAYRIWVAAGAMPTRETLQARWEAFADPPGTKAK